MDFDLKQWEHQQQQEQDDESDDQQEQENTSAKLPKHLLPPPPSSSAGSKLSLFVPDHPSPSTKTHPSPRMWCYFTMAQWQELELQALIYRYMLFGATVPPELLQPIKKGLSHQPSSFSHHHQPHFECFLHYPHSQPFRFQAGYWGSASTDREPGRCRRTDGKKWQCSRDVVPGQKYCERHVHRGRNRSRKPVEITPTPVHRAAASPTNGSIGIVNVGYLKSNTNSVTVAVTGDSRFAVSGDFWSFSR